MIKEGVGKTILTDTKFAWYPTPDEIPYVALNCIQAEQIYVSSFLHRFCLNHLVPVYTCTAMFQQGILGLHFQQSLNKNQSVNEGVHRIKSY